MRITIFYYDGLNRYIVDHIRLEMLEILIDIACFQNIQAIRVSQKSQ